MPILTHTLGTERNVGVTLTLGIALVMVASAAVATLCAVVLWERRTLVGARSLAIASVAVTVWALLYAAELIAPTLDAAVTFGNLQYLGICLLPPAWLAFALRYTGRMQLISRSLILRLSIHPLIVFTLLALPSTRELIRGGEVGVSASGIPEVSLGPLFWPHYAYVMGVMAAAAILIASALIKASRRYVRQSVALIAALCVPWIVNVAFNWPGSGIIVDPSPPAYALVNAVFVWGVLNFRLFDVVPIAREVVLDTLDDVVIVIDGYGRIVDLNTAAEQLFETPRNTAYGESMVAFFPDHPDLGIPVDQPTRREISLARGDAVVDFEVRLLPIRAGVSVVPGHIVVLRDITERRRAQRRLEHMVNYDQLTGLPNRSLYEDRLDQALALARRSGERVAVLFLDLDGFKEVNDKFGHDIGDLVLKETGQRLLDCLRASDTAARMGGDEFMIILPAVADVASAGAVSQKILDAIALPYTAAGQRLTLSVSIGIAVALPQEMDRRMLGRLADAAMYDAKATGKNCFAFSPHRTGGGSEVSGDGDLTVGTTSGRLGSTVGVTQQPLRR